MNLRSLWKMAVTFVLVFCVGRQVEAAMSGEHLASNFTPHCDPPPVTSPPYIPLSEKTLKVSTPVTSHPYIPLSEKTLKVSTPVTSHPYIPLSEKPFKVSTPVTSLTTFPFRENIQGKHTCHLTYDIPLQ